MLSRQNSVLGTESYVTVAYGIPIADGLKSVRRVYDMQVEEMGLVMSSVEVKDEYA